jgi:hypothetical protein
MPVELERKLKKQVANKDWSQKRKDAYVWGTLRKTGWKPERERNALRQSERKPDRSKKNALRR